MKDILELEDLTKPAYNYYVDLLNAFGEALYNKINKGYSLSYEESRWLHSWEKNDCDANKDEPQLMCMIFWSDNGGQYVRKTVAKFNKDFDQSKEITLRDCVGGF